MASDLLSWQEEDSFQKFLGLPLTISYNNVSSFSRQKASVIFLPAAEFTNSKNTIQDLGSNCKTCQWKLLECYKTNVPKCYFYLTSIISYFNWCLVSQISILDQTCLQIATGLMGEGFLLYIFRRVSGSFLKASGFSFNQWALGM